MAYIADETGEKKLVYSVQVYKDKNGESVYKEKRSVDDENGLPVYDKQGHFTTKEERWTSDNSTDSKGEAERRGGLMRLSACLLGPISFRKNRFRLNRAMCRHLIREFFLKTA